MFPVLFAFGTSHLHDDDDDDDPDFKDGHGDDDVNPDNDDGDEDEFCAEKRARTDMLHILFTLVMMMTKIFSCLDSLTTECKFPSGQL